MYPCHKSWTRLDLCLKSAFENESFTRSLMFLCHKARMKLLKSRSPFRKNVFRRSKSRPRTCFSKLLDVYKRTTDVCKATHNDSTEGAAMKDADVKRKGSAMSELNICHSAEQEQIMKALSFRIRQQCGVMNGKMTLGIDPNHPVLIGLSATVSIVEQTASKLRS